MYEGTAFEHRPALVSTPFTPISLIDGLGYFLPVDLHSQEADGDKAAIDVHLALSEPLWEILQRDEQLRSFSSMNL
jgi:hypothetical protein